MIGTLTPGTVFAGYLIERVLGAGGMGAVYLARHPRFQRRDALKVLSSDHAGDPEFRARFVREADLAARLDHPNIIAVHDRGVEHGRLWIAMRFVDGIDVAELIRRMPGGLPPAQAVDIVAQAASGLDAAHRAGMLHRDVKPANLLLEARQGEPDRVIVTDFGIAKAAGQSTVLTETGAVLATLAYAAPEQLTATGIDHRADVYALGCTLFELLTGAKPFPRVNAAAVMQAHLQDRPPSVSAANSAVPRAMDAVIARALAKRPEERFGSCGELAAAAAAALAGYPVSAFDAPVSPRRVGRIAVIAAMALAITAAIVSVVVLVNNSSGSSAEVTAVTRAPTSTAVTPPPSTAAASASWGTYSFVPQLFPGLLPAGPDVNGYLGIHCYALNKDHNPVDLHASLVKEIVRFVCDAPEGGPFTVMTVSCSTDGFVPGRVPLPPDVQPVGDEQWERASGRGWVLWGNSTNNNGKPTGHLAVQFDIGPRDICVIVVRGANNGQELYDNWWKSAPI